MREYQIGPNYKIVEYAKKDFAKWQVVLTDNDGKDIPCSQCFNDFYNALLYIVLSAKGTEANRLSHAIEFIVSGIDNDPSRFGNTRVDKELYNQLQKVNEFCEDKKPKKGLKHTYDEQCWCR